jgi:hypothetical protein
MKQIYAKFSVSTGFAKLVMHILLILCYNGSLKTWTVVGLTAAKFKPLIFSMSGFTLSYTVNMFILMILYDFSLLTAQFCYTECGISQLTAAHFVGGHILGN